MLALNHRISDDVDLFVDSPGWLPYVSPRLNDLFENELSGYNEDNAHVKLRFAEGEIDFVVAAPLLPDTPDIWNPSAPETRFPLEPQHPLRIARGVQPYLRPTSRSNCARYRFPIFCTSCSLRTYS